MKILNFSEDVVPVTNRRCLCELAKQIGFVDEAKKLYSLQNQLAMFRHLVYIFSMHFQSYQLN